MAPLAFDLHKNYHTMKYLTLLRHAKAAPAVGSDPDLARPLTDKGNKQISQIGPIFLKFKKVPERIVSSPAARALQTAKGLARVIDWTGDEVVLDTRIYEASVATLIAILQEQSETVEHVVLVGHNPGLEMLISALCSGDDGRLNLHFPTGGVAHIELEVARWRQVRWGCGILRLLVSPRYTKRM
jgi:phosphohistidine phosphatase